MKLSCAIYANEGIILLSNANEDKVLIPEELAAYPRIVTNRYGSRILMNEGSEKPEILEAIKEHIRTLINHYKKLGTVCIEMPSFCEMLIYNYAGEAPAEPYPNIDELLNSFLCGEGAELIV